MTEKPTRRAFLSGGIAAGATIAAPAGVAWPKADQGLTLDVGQTKTNIVGDQYPDTQVWTYNDRIPGPIIRARRGDRLRARVRNHLAQPTTVHFHGIRMPNAMDGVPFVTQPPIEPKASFVYDFALPDAGTYWYHPHFNSSEQVGRGLAGALVVEEHAPIAVDRDIVWVLDDWRLDRSAAIAGQFGHPRDLSHNGRIGNTVTVNGRLPVDFAVRSGERIRLRLINVANARIFGLRFDGHSPRVIALDGQPTAPHAPDDDTVIVAPAQRTDLLIDMTGAPGKRFTVSDRFYRRRPYKLLDIAYKPGEPLRKRPLDAPIALPKNAIPEPDLNGAIRHEIVLEGGAMGGMTGARMGGGDRPARAGETRLGMRELVGHGLFWALNGVAMAKSARRIEPILTLRHGRSCVLTLRNETAWDHPMHLHGHSFRVIARNGRPVANRPWRDTVLVRPRETVQTAFVADNLGDWMFHCHILEHQMAGMMGTIRVA